MTALNIKNKFKKKEILHSTTSPKCPVARFSKNHITNLWRTYDDANFRKNFWRFYDLKLW